MALKTESFDNGPVRPGSRQPLLVVSNVFKRHPSADRWLLDDVSLSIAPGEAIGISGPSGSGKSLLLRVMAQLTPYEQGMMLWQGNAISDPDIPSFRSHVAYVRQTPALGDGSVLECIQAPFAYRQHAKKSFDRPQIERSLKTLGKSPDLLAQETESLSGGERQIVQLLRTLQLDPRVLLLDEPTAALDPESTQQVEMLIKTWKHQTGDRALVWVSHSPEQLERLVDTQYQMTKGKLSTLPIHESL